MMLAVRIANAETRTRSLSRCIPRRFYRPTYPSFEDENEEGTETSQNNTAAVKLKHRKAALDYNKRNADYKRQVSLLRRSYAEEVAKQRASDMAEQEAVQKERTRKRLERQRLKNIRTAQNALRQEELRQQRAKEFEEHLRVMQEKRESMHARYTAARQLVIDELEEEAPLWMISAEEVEERFTPEAEQLLWARPGGVLGAPNPSIDSHFWQYETHTWHMNRTYKSQREMLLEELEEHAYEKANVDPSFWTPRRVEKQRRLEEKARLRAMVRSTGRMELLKKQQGFIEEQRVVEKGEIPKPEGVPNLRMLNSDKVLEREGARHLLKNPTRFFKFENASSKSSEAEAEDNTRSDYAGPSLGSPVGLFDPLRPNGEKDVFPEMVGKHPKPDTRTEKEKKQAEREARMMAAAQGEDDEGDVDLFAGDRNLDEMGPPLDYDDNDWDSDDEEWHKGLDPVADKEVIETPHNHRYTEEDIEWVVSKLEKNVSHFEQQYKLDVETLQQRARTQMELDYEQRGEAVDENSLESIVLNMPDDELIALSELDGEMLEGSVTEERLSAASKLIPSLTEDQLRKVLSQSQQQNSE